MSSREAEAWSIRAALLWMKEWRSQKCIFELDAKSVVDAVHGIRGYSNFTIIEECEEILKHFQEVLVVFENRSANRVSTGGLFHDRSYGVGGLCSRLSAL